MEPLTTLSTALAATKTLRDLVKSEKPNIVAIRDATTALQDSLIDLQGTVLEGQQREATLADDKRRLANELSRLRDGQRDLLEYRLENVAPGAAVYVHQPSKGDPETAHWLCQPCADAGRKTVLQLAPSTKTFGLFICPRCKGEVKAREHRPGGQTEQRPMALPIVVA